MGTAIKPAGRRTQLLLSSTALINAPLAHVFSIHRPESCHSLATQASFDTLFERPAGVAFLDIDEGRAAIEELGVSPRSANCTLQMNANRPWDIRPSLLALPTPNLTDMITAHGSGRKLELARCPVIHVRGNLNFAPVLESNPKAKPAADWIKKHGLGCDRTFALGATNPRAVARAAAASAAAASAADDVSGSEPSEPPPLYFAAASRHLFSPRASSVGRADTFISRARGEGEALIGVHIRAALLSRVRSSFRSASTVFSHAGFAKCVAKLRNHTAPEAGYSHSRVYVAADVAAVRQQALDILGEAALVEPPSYISPSKEREHHFSTIRGNATTAGALEEMLLLARADAIIVWDMVDSTYSAVAASWAAHRAAGQRSNRRAWMGVFDVSKGCKRVPDEQVEPPTHWHFLPGVKG